MSQIFSRRRGLILRDMTASLLVFLVALPLCLGIALGSGATPAQGIITGIIGGIVAGSVSGAAMQVSGPAAGLTVLVFGIIHDHGVAALGPAVLAAGFLQLAGGFVGAGRLVRSIPVAVVEAMLAAIGITIASAQVHVMMDQSPHSGVFANIAALPPAVAHANWTPAGLAAATILAVLVWERAAPRALRGLPPALVGVILASGLAAALHLQVHHVDLPSSLLHALRAPDVQGARGMLSIGGAISVVSLALIASIESLLSAAAIQRMVSGARGHADFDRELRSQGIGNMLCGAVGALPMTGVIVRSAANVSAGARSRASAVLHGVWLLALVELFPGVLRAVPTASLAGLLALVGVRLVSPAHIRAARAQGALVEYGITLVVALASSLVWGVVLGSLYVQGQKAYVKWRANERG